MAVAAPEIYAIDRFEARRKVFKLFGAGFTLLTPDGRVLARSEQKAFRLKEDIRVLDGGDGDTEILSIRADRVIDFGASYRVIDSTTGEVVGALRRQGIKSLFRDSWEILDADGVPRGRVVEDSGWKALVRRIHDGVAYFLPQAFHLEVDGQVVGTMTQGFNPFVQKFAVDLSLDSGGLLPRPLAVATVILLLAIEGRQG